MSISTKDRNHIKSILLNIPKENFELQKVLGHSYFNGVVVVRNNKLAGRIENIKFLQSVEPNLREQFMKEGKVLGAIQHKNIPRVYDIAEYEDFLIFRSEHIEGYSLTDVLEYLKKKKKDFPRYAAANIILKLMNALYYTHNEVRYERKKKSIIHCDIKPSNIILSAKDYKVKNGNGVDDEFIELIMQNRVEPFLIDFGIAKFKGESKHREGTVNYLSPEQLSDSGAKVDWRSDMHQLLLVYHEMLTKKQPYSNIPKSRIINYKLTHDFKTDKSIPSLVRDLIEKGTKANNYESFRTEKECIRAMAKVEARQKAIRTAKKYKKPVLASLIILLFIFATYSGAIAWDEKVRSTDALVKKIEQNPDYSLQELESAVLKLQTRAFEKKYYEPLIKGEFRDKKTGNPMYPSHLNVNGEWILVGPETEEAGVFTGLLFAYAKKYPDKYPYLINYAQEYAEPILQSDFDGTSGKRFQYALIPAYEQTGDERYLAKLVNVSNTAISFMNSQKGMTQCDDLYFTDLFLFVYKKTGERKYLEFYDDYVRMFVKNNIDSDGYIYMFASVNAMSPYGLMPDAKANWRIIPTAEFSTGIPVELNEDNSDEIKFIAGMYTKDFIETINTLTKMHNVTNNFEYTDSLKSVLNYYQTHSDAHSDYAFVSPSNSIANIPKDSLSTIKSIYMLQNYNETSYENKLRNFVSSDNFRTEKEEGIIRGNIYMESLNYVDVDERNKNQTLIMTDALFLELTVRN